MMIWWANGYCELLVAEVRSSASRLAAETAAGDAEPGGASKGHLTSLRTVFTTTAFPHTPHIGTCRSCTTVLHSTLVARIANTMVIRRVSLTTLVSGSRVWRPRSTPIVFPCGGATTIARACLHIRRYPSGSTPHLHTRAAPAEATDPATIVPSDESFYQHYLSVKVNPPKFDPCGALLRKDASACRDALPQHLRAEPLTAFSDSDTSPAVATQALEFYVAQACSTADKLQARATLAKERVGSTALLWFFGSQHLHSKDPNHEKLPFYRVLALCIYAEGAEEYLWNWLTMGDIRVGLVLTQEGQHQRDL